MANAEIKHSEIKKNITPQPADLIISAAKIMPLSRDGSVLNNCSLVVNKGVITAILPTAEACKCYSVKEHVRLDEHVLMPGLINAHGHSAMTLLRGYADDLPLMQWLQDHIWPAEKNWVDEQFVQDGTELAIAEMIKSGTTCFSDMYFYPEIAAKVVRTSAIRAQITFPILDFPTPWARTSDEAITKGLALRDNCKGLERITIGFGPHAPYTVCDEVFERVAMLSAELQAPIQVHLHETALEVSEAINNTGERPLSRLHQLGVITPLTQCVHMTTLSDDDIDLLSQSGASVVHCPESNLKLNSGLCPTQQLIDAGITVALGTDGAASNNDLDMFGELQSAALIGKISANSASAINAYQALNMATLNGAKALGIDHLTGSLDIGKACDAIAVKLNNLSTVPLYHLASQLVYTNQSANVSDVWVEGKRLLRDGLLTTLDESAIKQKAQAWAIKIGHKPS